MPATFSIFFPVRLHAIVRYSDCSFSSSFSFLSSRQAAESSQSLQRLQVEGLMFSLLLSSSFSLGFLPLLTVQPSSMLYFSGPASTAQPSQPSSFTSSCLPSLIDSLFSLSILMSEILYLSSLEHYILSSEKLLPRY